MWTNTELGDISNLTPQRGLAISDDLFRTLVEHIPNGVLITDASGVIEYVNPAFEEITGYSATEAIGQNPRFLQSGRQSPSFYEKMWSALATTGSWQGEVWNRHKSGRLYAEWLSISAEYDEDGEVLRYFGMFCDISTLAEASAGLQRLAYRDALTGLPNRVLFGDRIEQAMRVARREMSGFALLFVDLDGFKRINDVHGHAVGDEVLVQVGHVLEASLRASDTVARLGGDEFAAIVGGAQRVEDIERICQEIIESVRALSKVDAPLGASIGIAFYPREGQDSDSLIKAADAKMYKAKQAGGSRWRAEEPPSAP